MNKTYPVVTMIGCLLPVILVGLACNNSMTTVESNSASNSTSSTSGPSTPATSSANAAEISGNYTISGTNEAGGGQYEGSLIVTKRDEVYQFSWSSGDRTYNGVGVRTDDSVGVAFTEGADGKGCGVILYKVGTDGSLDGKAGYWGVNQSETEKATRTSGTDLEGTYDVAGSNPNGKDYKGKLTVKKDGAGYSFAWDAGNTFTGFGIRGGDKVVVGFGGSQCGFVGYDLKPDGTLNGKWGSSGSTSVGTEIAKKK